MGEYAKFRGQEIKIGTCENMYYLRADQARAVEPLPGNVDAMKDGAAGEIRFRFPFPTEDQILPGAFDDHTYGIALDVDPPTSFEHYTIQFSSHAGYLVSLPCPASEQGKKFAKDNGLRFHKNGWAGGQIKIIQQRYLDNKLMLVCSCVGCGASFRYPTAIDALPVLEELARLGQQTTRAMERGETNDAAPYYTEIAQRILDGYTTKEPFAFRTSLGRKAG